MPEPARYWDLLEAFICFEVSGLQAQSLYGVQADYENALYQKWWTRNHYEITVDGKIVNWAGIPMQGQPLGGMVPYVYVPHIRAGEFYGISLLERKQELAQEINERTVCYGVDEAASGRG